MTNYLLAHIPAILMFFMSCTATPQKQIEGALNMTVGAEAISEDIDKQLDKALGSKKTVFKTSLAQHLKSKVQVQYYDLQIKESTATVKVRTVIPRVDQVGDLLKAGQSIDKKKLQGMYFERFIKEIRGPKKKMLAFTDFKTETYEFNISLVKKKKDWICNPAQVFAAYKDKHRKRQVASLRKEPGTPRAKSSRSARY